MEEINERVYHFPVQIYYEDTDHSGMVYHANYLKYFERARENVIGVEELSRLWYEEELGFAVYRADIGFYEGAQFGDTLDIRTTWEKDGKFKIIWTQEAWRPGGKKAAVAAKIELVCIDKNKKLKPIPEIDM